MNNENSKAYLRTTSGYPLTLMDCVDSNIMSLSVAGNAIQDGTPTPDIPVDVVGVGDRTANLLDWSLFIDFNNWKHDEYGETAGGIFRFKIDVKPGIKYIIMFKNECDKVNILLYGSSKTTIQTNKIYQIETDKDYFYISANVYNQLKVDELAEIVGGVMLLECTYTANTIPEYEPYGYRVPIECRGRSLFDGTMYTKNANYVSSISGSTINFHAGYSGAVGWYWTNIKVKQGKTYTIFVSNMVGMGGRYRFSENEIMEFSGEVYSYAIGILKEKNIATFSANTDGYLVIAFNLPADSIDGYINELQVLEGSYTAETIPPYELYYYDIINVYMKKPLYRIDNYTDSIALDFENRTAIRTDRIKETMLSAFSVYRKCENVIRFAMVLRSYKGARMMCNGLKCLAEGKQAFTGNFECLFMHTDLNTRCYFSLNKTRIGAEDTDTDSQLIEKVNAYLADNPIMAYYKLGTPIETDISDTIDWDSLSLHLRKGTNIITSTATVEPTGMTAKYYSTRLYNTNYLKRRHMILMNNIKFKGYLRTTSAYPLTLTDCMDSDIVSLSVVGNAVQDGKPSPDAPVEVVGVGDKTEPYGYRVPIECRGRNLFDMNKVITDGVVSNNGITAKNIDFFLTAGTYTLQLTANASCSVWLRKGQVDKGYFSQLNLVTDVSYITSFTFDSDMYLRISTFATDVMFYDIQILEGTYTAETMPSYEPYYHDTVNIYTDKLLYGIDDYTDSITLDFANKKAVRTDRIQEVNITEPYKPSPVYKVINDHVLFSYRNADTTGNGVPGSPMLSNILENIVVPSMTESERIWHHTSLSTNMYFSLNKARFSYEDGDGSDVLYEKCKAYLSENPLIAYYVRLEPTETDISDTIDWDSLSLHLHKGTNILTSTATVEPMGMTAEYYSSKEV